MTAVAIIEQASTLPVLVQRAANRLASAVSSAEILEAREIARAAISMGDAQARLAKLKGAHDEVMSAIYHAQADAHEIEFNAKRRLAEEYDAARARGEVRGEGGDQSTRNGDNSAPTTAELGLSRGDIHDGRLVAQAEAIQPGATRLFTQVQAEEGRRPTAAETRRAFREVVHNVGQRPAERVVITTDTALISILDMCRKLDAQIERVGIERLAEAVPEADPRLAAVPVIQATRNRLNEWLEAL